MKKEQFFQRHHNLNVQKAELERKYQAYLREQEDLRMLYEAAMRSSSSASATVGGGGGGGGGGPIAGFDLLLNFSANSPQVNPFAGTVADPSSISEWNTFFDLPNKGTPFTSVLVSGDIVILQGSNNLAIKTNLFENALYIKQIVDAGCVTEIESYGLSKYPVSTLEYAVFPNLITIGDGAFFNTLLTVIDFPKVETVGISAFHDCYNVTTVNLPEMISCDTDSFQSIDAVTSISIPSCQNLGETVGFNSVFNDVSGQTITLTVPTALMTCDSGNPDGDILYLQANNTVTIITV
jgi:hypothetical protein